MFYTYILQSHKDKRTYVGHTNNIHNRLNRHNAGLVSATKYRFPFKLLYLEKHSTLKEAKSRELYWKSGAGRRKLKAYFNENKPLT